jgi:hypothetical protein
MKNYTRRHKTDDTKDKVHVLKTLLETCTPLDRPVVKQMLSEQQDMLDYLTSNKEYMVYFHGGGYNTIYALDEEQALEKAKAKYNDLHTKVDNVREATAQIKKAVSGLFY